MKKGLMITVLVLLIKSSFGQEFTDLYGDYFGQTPPDDTPVVFAPGIISRNTLEHSAAIFSSDGNEVYWCWRQNTETKLHINFMKRINNRWTQSTDFAPFGDSVNYWDPFLSLDNKRFYFTADPNGNIDIWYVERKQDNEWGEPQSISPVINNTEVQLQAVLTSNGTLYYVSELGTTGSISRSKYVNGNYSQPELLPSCINRVLYDSDPYIAPDDSYMLFASRRPNSFRNSGIIYQDIYISFHDLDKNTWSEPINLGEPINTDTVDRLPAISPDGKYLFFTRYNDENEMDVYWVSVTIIDRIREKNNIKK